MTFGRLANRSVRIMGAPSATSPDAAVPGSAISGGYTGDSFTVETLIVLFSALSMYNAVELLVLIFFTFSRYRGLYFYSLLIASICVIPYSLGFLFKFLEITQGKARWLAVTFVTIGWYGMVTGQSVVLWSRLHLLVDKGPKGQRLLRWTKWMIIIDAIILQIPTTVLTYGSNGRIEQATFVSAYNVMEKVQMCGFFIQEMILSTLYILQAAKLLRNSTRDDTKRFFIQLLGINVIIIIMDLGLLGVEAASFYLYETIFKGVIYSIKLKLEFAVLSKLVMFVGGRPGTSTANEERWRRASVAFAGHASGLDGPRNVDGHANTNGDGANLGMDEDISDFVDLSKVQSDISHPAHDDHGHHGPKEKVNGSIRGNDSRSRSDRDNLPIPSGRGISEADIDIARFEHMDDVQLPSEDGSDEKLPISDQRRSAR